MTSTESQAMSCVAPEKGAALSLPFCHPTHPGPFRPLVYSHQLPGIPLELTICFGGLLGSVEAWKLLKNSQAPLPSLSSFCVPCQFCLSATTCVLLW